MKLYGYYRSTASWRVRIALNLKGLKADHLSRHLRKGVAAALLRHIIDEARRRGCRRLCLETGSAAAFAPPIACMPASVSSTASRLRITSPIRTACS